MRSAFSTTSSPCGGVVDRGIVGEAERPRIDRERPEVAFDQFELAGPRHHDPASEMSTENSAGRSLRASDVEHGIDHAGDVGIEEGAGDVDIFADHDPAGTSVRPIELLGAGAQDGAERRVDPLERPAGRQRRRTAGIERPLVAHDARRRCRGRRRRRPRDTARRRPRGRAGTTRTRRARRAASSRRCRAGRAPAPRRAAPRRAGWPAGRFAAIGRLRRASQAAVTPELRAERRSSPAPPRRRAPPLLPSPTRARAHACSSFSTVRMP